MLVVVIDISDSFVKEPSDKEQALIYGIYYRRVVKECGLGQT